MSDIANVEHKQLKYIRKTLKVLIKCLTKLGGKQGWQVDFQNIPTQKKIKDKKLSPSENEKDFNQISDAFIVPISNQVVLTA